MILLSVFILFLSTFDLVATQTPKINLNTEAKTSELEAIKKELSKLLEYGNNEAKLSSGSNGSRTPCKIEPEDEFFDTISNSTDIGHIYDSVMERKANITSICNRFKYFTCDNKTKNCVCLKNLNWYPTNFTSPDLLKEYHETKNRSEVYKVIKNTIDNEVYNDFGKYNGTCKFELKVPELCYEDSEKQQEVINGFKKPFQQNTSHEDLWKLFDNVTLSPPENSACNYTMNWYECGGGNGSNGSTDCRDSKSFLADEYKLLEYYTLIYFPRTYWTTPCTNKYECKDILIYGQRKVFKKKQNDLGHPIQQPLSECVPELQWNYRRSPKENFTWDLSRIKEVIVNGSMEGYCNPFTFQVCKNGICVCPSGDKGTFGKSDIYVMEPKTGRCIPKEGVHCTRYFWYNGKWTELYDKCGGENLTCTLAPDKMSNACCNEGELNKTTNEKSIGYSFDETERGRCRNSRRPKGVANDYFETNGANKIKNGIHLWILLLLFINFM